jgi:hypothetical protein
MKDQTDTNSKRTRIEPIFKWLKTHGAPDWGNSLLRLADGLLDLRPPGHVGECRCEEEVIVPPCAARLAWMIRNVARLVPVDGRLWQECTRRLRTCRNKEGILAALDADKPSRIPAQIKFETGTHADCLIRCEKAIIWIEGKRHDWLSPSTKWDIVRDQLARNVEAAWMLARKEQKDYWVIVCYESALKHHEEQLIQGYRNGTWNGGWPHLSQEQRKEFSGKIGTLTWVKIVQQWPELRSLKELRDI